MAPLAVRRTTAAALLLAVALLPPGCGGHGARPSSSTLEATYVDADGDGVLELGPGEPLIDRTELAPRARPGRALATLVQISDAHVRDEESPARVPAIDRLGSPFESTFRPQEALTAQVLAATVRSANALRPSGVLVSGDLADNAQANELEASLAALRGGVVRPDSGSPGYDGVQAASDPDPFFYRPDVDAPRFPGLLDRAQRPFRSPGLRVPWFPVAGNHDLLLAGEAPPTAATAAVAVGDRATAARDPASLLPPGAAEAGATPGLVDRAVADALSGPTRRVPADPARRLLDPTRAVDRLRRAAGAPGTGPRLDYAVDLGPRVRLVVLDTVDRDGGSGATVAADQLAWLDRQLAAAGPRWVLLASHQPLASSQGGRAVLARADRSPRVIATIAGHTHRNRIRPRRTPAGGYWLIETASLVDFPQQARALRLRATTGGGVAIETWMLDHDDRGAAGALAATSRRLAFLDVQGGRPQRFAGSRRARNVRLYRGRAARSANATKPG
ncbi:MAG: hypothetical protein ACR2ML_03160 [Solirubrobacteraceae bacterium]